MKAMLMICLVVTLYFAVVGGNTNWVSLAKYRDFETYFTRLMQQTLYEVEEYGWWNLALDDVNDNVNLTIYDRNFAGPVNYANGFLLSIQRIDFTRLLNTFIQGTVTYTVTGTMAADLELHEVAVGFDAFTHMEDQDHRFTGIFTFPIVSYAVSVSKNLNTSEITTTFRLSSLNVGSGNYVQFLPQTDVSDVLQRFFQASMVYWDSVARWGTQVLQPTMSRLLTKEEFQLPEVCFRC